MILDTDLKIEKIIRQDADYQALLNEALSEDKSDEELCLLDELIDLRCVELGIAIVNGKWAFIRGGIEQ